MKKQGQAKQGMHTAGDGRVSVSARRLALALLLFLTAVSGGATAQDNTGTPAGRLVGMPGTKRVHDAEGMYARAAMMLEDRSIQNVSSVPAMLESCVRVGHLGATRLLMDVYEGKYKGLAAQPKKAAELAYTLAKAEPAPDESAAARELRHEAMFRCALYCERGYGCKKSDEDAYGWMCRAAVEDMSVARVELARYLMQGKGHARSPRAAMLLLREQAAKAPKTPNLFFYLGHMYMRGIGLAHPDRRMALRCYEMGASWGDARATNNLASMYERGIGVSRNTAHALRLYKIAAAAGSKDASANLQRLALKEGEKATGLSSGYGKRIDNASLRVITALPLPEHIRELLSSLFQREKAVYQP